MLQENSFPAELDAATQRIKRLKDRYAWRRRTCGLASIDVPLQESKDEDREDSKGAEQSQPSKDSSALKVLVAKCLLDPALTIPIDATSLHKKARSTLAVLHRRAIVLQC